MVTTTAAAAAAATARPSGTRDNDGTVAIFPNGMTEFVASQPSNSGHSSFTSETWTMVDLQHEPPLTEGATPLVARCIRHEGWTESYTRRILKAYVQWLQLKLIELDWNATKLSPPSQTIDKMWHWHILDVRNYYNDCILLCGHVVHHDPDGGLDPRARKVRLRNTANALRQNFPPNQIDGEIWREVLQPQPNDNAAEEINRPGRNSQQQPAAADSAAGDETAAGGDVAGGGGRDSRLITIRIKDQTGDETIFKIKRSTKLRKVFQTFAIRKGFSLCSFRFLLNGGVFTPSRDYDRTCDDYDLEDNDQIDVILEQAGC